MPENYNKDLFIFRQISTDKLHRFSQSFHHMKALWVQIMYLYIIFQYVNGHCHGNQIMLREMRM